MLRIIINKIGTDYNGDILEIISGAGTEMCIAASHFRMHDHQQTSDIAMSARVFRKILTFGSQKASEPCSKYF